MEWHWWKPIMFLAPFWAKTRYIFVRNKFRLYFPHTCIPSQCQFCLCQIKCKIVASTSFLILVQAMQTQLNSVPLIEAEAVVRFRYSQQCQRICVSFFLMPLLLKYLHFTSIECRSSIIISTRIRWLDTCIHPCPNVNSGLTKPPLQLYDESINTSKRKYLVNNVRAQIPRWLCRFVLHKNDLIS